eukprot:Mrub_08972.p1 GENE.Mrub_08972~~Mrub_08972.p1  ORF type:complete len:225 (+),score=27.35 Mrub_08972:82-756(+)
MNFNLDLTWSISFKPFLLNPNIPKEGMTLFNYLTKKGIRDPNHSFQGKFRQFKQIGTDCSFEYAGKTLVEPFIFDYSDLPLNKMVYNSIQAHRAAEYTLQNHGIKVHKYFSEILFMLYFSMSKDISNVSILEDAFKSCLTKIYPEVNQNENIEKFSKFINNNIEYPSEKDILHSDDYYKEHMGVSGVPFFIFNDVLTVTGAQDYTYFLNVLDQIVDEKGEMKLN